jgi:ribosomal protein S18 acetylase RimI-like enzyme
MGAVTIVELPIERWRDYRAIRLSALRTDPIAFGERYQDALNHPDELWQQRLDGSTSIIRFAERGRRIVGLAAALLGSPDDEHRAQIVSVFVEPDHRGFGIGRLLLDRILSDLAACPHITRLRLNVTETQSAAKTLYESLGFVVVGVEEHPAADGEDRCVELVMERDNHIHANA